jgi:hypothetical protein
MFHTIITVRSVIIKCGSCCGSGDDKTLILHGFTNRNSKLPWMSTGAHLFEPALLSYPVASRTTWFMERAWQHPIKIIFSFHLTTNTLRYTHFHKKAIIDTRFGPNLEWLLVRIFVYFMKLYLLLLFLLFSFISISFLYFVFSQLFGSTLLLFLFFTLSSLFLFIS